MHSLTCYHLTAVHFKYIIMKKLFFVLAAAILTISTVQAQTVPGDLSSATSGFNVKSLTKSIMGKLVPALKLTDTQKPGVTSAVTDFLTQKAKILPLQQTDAGSYSTKFTSLFSGLKTKLGGLISPTQLTSFMGLKPSTNDPKNVLSNLFY